MRALTYHGKRDVRVDTVPDPTIQEPTDAIVRITSTGLCGSDLHLYEVLGAVHRRAATSSATSRWGSSRRSAPRSRTSRPATASSSRSTSPAGTASCAIRTCTRSARRPRCASRGRAPRCSATPSCTARSRADRPSCCGCRRRSSARSRFRTARRTSASSTSPTCCRPPGRRVEYAAVPDGGTLVVFGLGPIGQMACRVALHRGAGRVIGLDLVPERLAMAARHGVETLDVDDGRRRGGRGPRADRRARPRQRDRRRRHGGARRTRRQARADARRLSPRSGRARR